MASIRDFPKPGTISPTSHETITKQANAPLRLPDEMRKKEGKKKTPAFPSEQFLRDNIIATERCTSPRDSSRSFIKNVSREYLGNKVSESASLAWNGMAGIGTHYGDAGTDAA